MGVTERNPDYEEFVSALANNNHLSLVQDKEVLIKYQSHMDTNKISQQYKQDQSYYKDYENKIEDAYPTSKLKETNVLVRNAEMNKLAKKLFNRDLSPLLVEKSFLVGLPKTYFIIFEWDYLKDEGILYAERLKEAGVDVKIAFYEKAFHGNLF